LTITTFSDSEAVQNKKKGIILSSRVHPGETGASYMIKGVIDYLVGPSVGARILRDHFVFKIIPMLNPDGVILGNTRCSLSGLDLNRAWQDPPKEIHPILYQFKELIKSTSKERELIMFCDFHGHSRKKNIFMYGNSAKNDTKYRERIFPFMFEKNAEVFSYSDCAFSVQKSKEGTGRVVGWKELGIQNSFTLEASFCGADFGKYADLHFNSSIL
jgi:murein tripeptide amidase MpaA